MRPVKLKIKGLNSFIDEQTIDFDKLTDRGFFGIFGPTGSGKSTILDGITLALYGSLSRKSSNYINTNCDRLSINFEFQISSNEVKRYIIDREFRRKKDGNINSGKCKIVDITDSEEILADSVKTINKKVEEIIGLNLDDFTRTVVLPQGKFSEFLKLEGKERRDMLERLFNLEQFGDNLGRKLNRHINKEKTENSVLIGQLSGYNDISEEKLHEKEEILLLLEEELKNLRSQLIIVEENCKANEELWNQKLELAVYKDKERVLKEKENEINKDIERIRLGEASEKVIPYVNVFENTSKEFTKTERELKNLTLNIEKIKEAQEEIDKLWVKVKDNKENMLPKFMIQEEKIKDAIEEKKLVDTIEEKINVLKLQIENVKNSLVKNEKDLFEIDNDAKEKTCKVKEYEKIYDNIKIDESLKEKVRDGIISEDKIKSLKVIIDKDNEKKIFIEKENEETVIKGKNLKEVIEKEAKVLDVKENQYKDLILNVPCEQKDLLNLKQVIIQNEQKWSNYNKFTKEINLSKEEIEKLQVEICKVKDEDAKYNEELDRLKNRQKEIMMENIAHTLRMELKNDEACPVCGSVHHIKENIKVLEIQDITTIEDNVKITERLIKNINNTIIQNQTKINNFEEKIKANHSEIVKLGDEFKEKTIEKLQDEFINLEKALENYSKQKEQLEKDINDLKK